MPILEFIGASFTYPDGHRALDDVSFSVDPGECVGLIGANGAGKSTLLLMLLGVLWAQSGQIRVGTTRLGRDTVKAIRSQVGLVFQDSDDQLFTASVGEDVAFGPRNSGLSESTVAEAVARALETTAISHLRDRAPYTLSGGEKRLAAIASVLSMDPNVVVMDEPSSGLDPKARRRLVELLGRLPQTRIIATHDLDLAWDVCDRVVVLRGGRVVANAKARSVLSDGVLLDECGLELPLRFGSTR